MHDYDPFALDAWSLGCVVAEMFTPIARTPFRHETAIRLDDLEDSKDGTSLEPFVEVHPETDSDSDADSDVESRDAQVEASFTIRQTLFDGSRGDLGLIWSILRVRGTPTSETWPVSVRRSMGQRKKIEYNLVRHVLTQPRGYLLYSNPGIRNPAGRQKGQLYAHRTDPNSPLPPPHHRRRRWWAAPPRLAEQPARLLSENKTTHAKCTGASLAFF
jgi:hypothetical protein